MPPQKEAQKKGQQTAPQKGENNSHHQHIPDPNVILPASMQRKQNDDEAVRKVRPEKAEPVLMRSFSKDVNQAQERSENAKVAARLKKDIAKEKKEESKSKKDDRHERRDDIPKPPQKAKSKEKPKTEGKKPSFIGISSDETPKKTLDFSEHHMRVPHKQEKQIPPAPKPPYATTEKSSQLEKNVPKKDEQKNETKKTKLHVEIDDSPNTSEAKVHDKPKQESNSKEKPDLKSLASNTASRFTPFPVEKPKNAEPHEQQAAPKKTKDDIQAEINEIFPKPPVVMNMPKKKKEQDESDSDTEGDVLESALFGGVSKDFLPKESDQKGNQKQNEPEKDISPKDKEEDGLKKTDGIEPPISSKGILSSEQEQNGEGKEDVPEENSEAKTSSKETESLVQQVQKNQIEIQKNQDSLDSKSDIKERHEKQLESLRTSSEKTDVKNQDVQQKEPEQPRPSQIEGKSVFSSAGNIDASQQEVKQTQTPQQQKPTPPPHTQERKPEVATREPESTKPEVQKAPDSKRPDVHVSSDQLREHKKDVARIGRDIEMIEAQLKSVVARKERLVIEKADFEKQAKSVVAQLEEVLAQEEKFEASIHELEKQELSTTDSQKRRSLEEQRWKLEDERAEKQQRKWDIQELHDKLDRAIDEKEIDMERSEHSHKELLQRIEELTKERNAKKSMIRLGEVEEKKREIEDIQVSLLEEKRRLDKLFESSEQQEKDLYKKRRDIEKQANSVESTAARRSIETERRVIERKQREVEQKRWEAEQARSKILDKVEKSNEHYATIEKIEAELRQKLQKDQSAI